MGLNTTGRPNTDDYVLGRGKLYIGFIDPVTGHGYGYRDVGNAPSFAINMESEELEHKSSMEGTASVDKLVVLSRKIGISFTVDEISNQNLSMFLAGAMVSLVNPAIAGVGTDLAPIEITDNVDLGLWYDLRDASGARVRFTTGASVIIKNITTPGTLVLNTDYTLDIEGGRIFIRMGATGLVAGDTISWWSAAEAGAPATLKTVTALAGSNERYALKFVQENAASSGDSKGEYEFHQISIRPDGDMSLIGDEWAQMSFSGIAEMNSILGKPVTYTPWH